MADNNVTLEFLINGFNTVEPLEWKGLKEFMSFGQLSNQPFIEGERFTFINTLEKQSADILFKLYKEGKILRGADVDVIYKQKGLQVQLFKGYEINNTKGFEIIDPYFNQKNSPLEIKTSILKKRGVQKLELQLKSISFQDLEERGFLSDKDYQIVPTAVMKLYNAGDVAIAILATVNLTIQLIRLTIQTAETAVDSIQRVTGLEPVSVAAGVVYVAAIIILRVLEFALLLVALVATILDILTLLVPPVVKNKALTFEKGIRAMLSFYGYDFETTIEQVKSYTVLPDKPHNNEENFIKNLLPTFPPTQKGYSQTNASIRNCWGFMEEVLKTFNGRLDFNGDKVVLRTEEDPSLYQQGKFKIRGDVKIPSERPNIEDIPSTRIISFLTDTQDEYTYENYRGTSFEVKNISKYQPFQGLEEIRSNLALGNAKTDLNNLEQVVLEFAKVADSLGKLLGANLGFAKKIKNNRSNILKVSSNTWSVPKLLPNYGRMTKSARSQLSAKVIENNWYINRSIKRGVGQKVGVTMEIPYNLQDRENVKDKGVFIDHQGRESRIEEVDYTFGDDVAEIKYQANFNYIAESDYEEVLTEPD